MVVGIRVGYSGGWLATVVVGIRVGYSGGWYNYKGWLQWWLVGYSSGWYKGWLQWWLV